MRKTILLIMLVALFATSCGGGGGDNSALVAEPTPTTTTTPTPTSTVIPLMDRPPAATASIDDVVIDPLAEGMQALNTLQVLHEESVISGVRVGAENVANGMLHCNVVSGELQLDAIYETEDGMFCGTLWRAIICLESLCATEAKELVEETEEAVAESDPPVSEEDFQILHWCVRGVVYNNSAAKPYAPATAVDDSISAAASCIAAPTAPSTVTPPTKLSGKYLCNTSTGKIYPTKAGEGGYSEAQAEKICKGDVGAPQCVEGTAREGWTIPPGQDSDRFCDPKVQCTHPGALYYPEQGCRIPCPGSVTATYPEDESPQGHCPQPTAIVVVTATPEPSVTATPEPSATATPEPSATATPEPSATATPEPTPEVCHPPKVWRADIHDVDGDSDREEVKCLHPVVNPRGGTS